MLRNPIVEVRLYGEWNPRIVLELGKWRSSYHAVLTRVPGGEVGIAYIVRLRRGQSVESVTAAASNLSTGGLQMDVRKHGKRCVRVILRGEEVTERVQRVRERQLQAAAAGERKRPALRALKSSVTRIPLERATESAVDAFVALVKGAIA